jgi:F-box domain
MGLVNHWESLSTEIACEVFKWVGLGDAIKCRLVCNKMKGVVDKFHEKTLIKKEDNYYGRKWIELGAQQSEIDNAVQSLRQQMFCNIPPEYFVQGIIIGSKIVQVPPRTGHHLWDQLTQSFINAFAHSQQFDAQMKELENQYLQIKASRQTPTQQIAKP